MFVPQVHPCVLRVYSTLNPKFPFKCFDKGVCEGVAKSEKETDEEKEEADKKIARERIEMKMTQTWLLSSVQ